jgi:colicin import membrane protein
MNGTAPLGPLLPEPPGGLATGTVVAVLAHVGLVAALTLSVQWRSAPAEVVAAELWAAVPQQAAPVELAAKMDVAAPRPAPVLPAPGQVDIAIERERERERERQAQREQAQRQQAERQQAERQQREKAQQRAAQEQRERQAAEQRQAEQRLAQQREENLRRILGQASGSTSAAATGSAAQDAAPSLAYGSRLIAHIKPNIVFTESAAGNPTAEVEVRTGAGGSIVARRLVKSSGNKDWDEAVLRAIDRTGSLPRDSDGRVPPLLLIKFRPND